MSNQRSVVRVGTPYDAFEQRRSVISVLALAGIAGPIIFAAAALVQSLLRTDHSLLEHPISALAAGSSGWVQDVNFLLIGSLMIAYAVGLHLGERPTRWGVVGLAFLVLSGLGFLWAGFVPATDATGAFRNDHLLHAVGPLMVFPGAGIGLIMVSRRMAADSRWQSVATYALTTGIAIMVLFLVGGALVRPPGAPLHAWLGLFQWILLAVWFPCTIILALRLLRVARAADAKA